MTEFLQEQAKRCSSIMKLTTIGTSKGGKPLYGLKVTENPELRKTKPQVGLVGSLEGTDITGKELLLKLIEYLCSPYERKMIGLKHSFNQQCFILCQLLMWMGMKRQLKEIVKVT